MLEKKGKTAKVSVLLVDDSAENLLALSSVLRDNDYELVLARSGQEALKHVLLKEFAVILLDVRMPEMDGFEVARNLKQRARSRHIPIIFLTAEASDVENVYLGYSIGAVDYLQKPLEANIVRAKVAIFVELHQKSLQILDQSNRLLEAERRQAEYELHVMRERSEKRYNEMANAIPHILWTTTVDGTTEFMNSRFEDVTGISSSNISDVLSFSNFLHIQDALTFKNRWNELQSQSVNSSLEVRLRSRDETLYRWHLCCIVPERDAENKIVGWIFTLTDIHEQKIATRAKDEFLATLSHELRTPLNVMLGWVELLKSEKLSQEEFDSTILMMDRNVRLLITLINDLLDVSRIITGKLQLDLKPVCMRGVVDSVVNSLQLASEEKEISLLKHYETETYFVEGDFARLQQVVWNLLSNAIKFTPTQGHVDVTIKKEDGKVLFIVKDSGKGIAPDFIHHVFDKFLQEDSTTTRNEGGLGLGLAIVRQLVDLHNGNVSASSDGRGKGSTFVVCLNECDVKPEVLAATSTIDIQRAGATSTDANGLKDVRILLVDDAPDVRFLLGRILSCFGANVTMAGSAEEALKHFYEAPPDLLVSDIGMPERDGISLIREIRSFESQNSVTKPLPAIALTAYAREEERARVLEAGFHIHVAKPVEAGSLKKALEGALSR